jgi:hypothetical protein
MVTDRFFSCPPKWASTLQLADSCGLTVFTLPRLMQSVQETQNKSDLAFGKWDFEKFRGFPSPLPPWATETEGGTKQAWWGKGDACFLSWHFSLFGASLCDTSRWWELCWEHRIKTAWPSTGQLKFSGDSVQPAGDSWAKAGRPWSSPSLSPLDMKRTEGSHRQLGPWPVCPQSGRGLAGPTVVCRTHHTDREPAPVPHPFCFISLGQC